MLAPDAHDAVTVDYLHLGEWWLDDVPWARDSSWTLKSCPFSVGQRSRLTGSGIWPIMVRPNAPGRRVPLTWRNL